MDCYIEMLKISLWPKMKRMFFTQPIYFFDDVIAVPPAEKLNAYEKLISPFDFHTWLLIILTFIAAFFTIFVVSFTRSQVRKLVFGSNVTSPCLNLVMLFFGMSQVMLPRRNFARCLVMVFVMYSMVIRTCWQSVMFQHMQKVNLRSFNFM